MYPPPLWRRPLCLFLNQRPLLHPPTRSQTRRPLPRMEMATPPRPRLPKPPLPQPPPHLNPPPPPSPPAAPRASVEAWTTTAATLDVRLKARGLGVCSPPHQIGKL